MKKILLPFLLFPILLHAQTISLKSGESLTVKPLWKTSDKLYFSKDNTKTWYYISLSDLSTFPTSIKTIEERSPETYLMKYREQELAGIWLGVLGTTTALIGGIAGTKGLYYMGTVFSVTGFLFTVTGFNNIKKRVVFSEAKPFKP